MRSLSVRKVENGYVVNVEQGQFDQEGYVDEDYIFFNTEAVLTFISEELNKEN